jgi:hypothetical protein
LAKLYFNPDFGTVVVRRDDDLHGTEEMIEVTPEQATAVSLSVIGQVLGYINDSLVEES